MAVSRCPCSTFSNAMFKNAKMSLVPKHQLIVPSTLLALATNIRTYKATKIHTLTPLTYVSKNVHVRIFGAKPVVAARSFLLSILYFITSLGWKFSNRTKRDCYKLGKDFKNVSLQVKNQRKSNLNCKI